MEDLFEKPEPISAHPLFPFQQKAVEDIAAAVRELKRSGKSTVRVLFQLATGGGKTRIMAELASLGRKKGSKVAALAPRRELVYQIRAALKREGVNAGVIMAGEHHSVMADTYVCSFDTLHARAIQRDKIQLPEADLLLVDEAHLAVADGRQEILSEYGCVQVLFTATPARGDGRGLEEIADVLVCGPSMRELIDMGRLVQPRYFAPSEPDLRAIKLNKDGDYQEKALGKAMDKPKLIGDIVDNWERLARDRSTVVFCTSRAHSRHVTEAFARRGYTAEHLDGETPGPERKAILARVSSGETQILCNVFVASYGLDIPRLSCAVLARPTKNISLYLQTVGRVLRAYPGKDDALIIDHSGAVKENGFAEDDHPWSLDGKEKIKDRIERQKTEAGAAKSIICPMCANVFSGRRICPKCGHQAVHPTEEIPTYKLDLKEVERPGKETVVEKRNRTTPPELKRQFMGELKHYAAEKGKSEGWVSHTYRDRFGVWPNAYKDAPPVKPQPDTLSFIRAKAIRFAKGRSAA